MSFEIRKHYLKYQKVIQNVLLILFFPLFLILTELVLSAFLNLGNYVGTFIRCLYELVVF